MEPRFCTNCLQALRDDSPAYEIRRHATEAECRSAVFVTIGMLSAALINVEWTFDAFRLDEDQYSCPVCRNGQSQGHTDECTTGRALALFRGEYTISGTYDDSNA
jgi:hypothetical protein